MLVSQSAFPVSQLFFFFPSIFEKVKVGRGVERRRGKRTESEKQKHGVPWSAAAGAAEAGQGRAQAGGGWTAGPHHPWWQTVRPTETGQEGLAADPAEEHGCTPQPSPSKWTDGHSANQPGLTGAHQASARHSAHRERGKGEEGPRLGQGGKPSEPGPSCVSAANTGGGCAGGGVTRVVGCPLSWALRNQAEAPT